MYYLNSTFVFNLTNSRRLWQRFDA